MDRKQLLEKIKQEANHVIDHFTVDSVERNDMSIDVTEYAITSKEEVQCCFAVTVYSHKNGKVEAIRETLVDTESQVMMIINAEMFKIL